MKYTKLLFFSLIIFLFVPGCMAVGPFSTKTLQKGDDLVIRGKNFTEDIDLTTILEFKPSAPGVMKAEISGSLIFENCQFYKFLTHAKRDGKTYMVEFKGDLVFDQCVFRDTTDFEYLIVEGDFYAGKSEFMGPASFNYAWFKGRNNILSNVTFYNQAWFNNAMFENRAHFFKTNFKDAAMFQSTVFKGPAFWGAAIFDDYTEFGKSRFLQDVDMGEVRFNDRTNFSGLNCLMTAVFNNSFFAQPVDFSNANFYLDPQFGGAKFEKDKKGLDKYMPEEENNVNP